jgi:hypothetical protein
MINYTERDSFELPLGTITEAKSVRLTPSPDAKRLAYAVQEADGRQHVEVNDRREPTYDDVCGLTFSPDSRRLAYAPQRGRQRLVVVDGREDAPCEDIGLTSPVFSPDSRHIAYTARRGGRWSVFRDGTPVGGPYEGFSPGGIVFSPNSARVIYCTKERTSWAVVVDGTQRLPHDNVLERSWGFTPDSREPAYVACRRTLRGTEAFVVVGARKREPWAQDEARRSGLSGEIIFSANGRRIAYGVTEKGQFFFVIDDVAQKRYDGLVSGWAGSRDWPRFPSFGKASCRSGMLTFSPDGRHFAYAVADRGRHVLVLDGDELERHEGILNFPAIFSPDSRRHAYAAQRGDKQFLVVDGRALEEFDGIPSVAPVFSPDSARVAYVVLSGGEYFLAVDDQVCLLRDGPIVGVPLVWDDATHLHTLVAARGRRVSVAHFEVT